ncbi:MAG: hypothetical protein ACTSYB_17770 [Candidatus Helarchaeota archaeon]
MGAVKVLIGLLFLALGIFILVISLAPIDLFSDISFSNRIMALFSIDFEYISSTMDFTPILESSGYLSISIIIPYVGYHYCRAGIKSMRYEKAKKIYYYSETKIALLIVGFIIICVAVALILSIFLQIMEPAFQFLVDLIPTLYFPGLLPDLLIPIVLTLLIIYFLYWIGSKIMKTGVKKEDWGTHEPGVI